MTTVKPIVIGVLSKRSDRHLLRSLARQAAGRARFIAFSPSDVDWRAAKVRAMTRHPSGNWQRATMPLPDVIYNRLLCGRKTELGPSLRSFRQKIKDHNIPYFNWSYFNKQDIFQLLHDGDERQAVRHLPETIHQPSVKQVERLLQAHRLVFLKPTGGFAGIGIYRLESHGGDSCTVRFHRGVKPFQMHFSDRKSLVAFVRRKTRGFRRYVAQQGIELLQYKGCPVDFRVHCNRNGKNRWAVSGIGAKKAGRGSVTTHMRTGGTVYQPAKLLRYFYRERASQVVRQLKQTTIRLAEAIARRHPHLVGELGFDIGIDRDGNFWMFEANAKPGRSIFKHPALRAAVRTCDRHIVEYCLYLAGNAGASGTKKISRKDG